MQFSGETPGVCGSWQTPMKFSGNSVQTRWMQSFDARDHSRLTLPSPMWCPMPEARGENNVSAVPRSRWMRS